MDVLQLIADLQAGRRSKAVQEELYSLTRSALLERLTTKLPPRLRARLDPEDVLQTAFLKATGAIGDFVPKNEHSFFAWVYQIAKNLMADQLKRRSAAAVPFARGEDDEGPRASQVAGRGRRAESLLQRKEWIDAVLGRLKEKEAEVIRLRWLEGKSFEEIAAAWRSTPGAVQRFHSRAWQRFREEAERAGEGEG